MSIGDKYKIESDSLNVTLYERAKSKTSVTQWRSITYFSSLQNALEHLVDLEVAETGLKDLQTVVEKQNELYTLVKKLGNIPERVEYCTGAEKCPGNCPEETGAYPQRG